MNCNKNELNKVLKNYINKLIAPTYNLNVMKGEEDEIHYKIQIVYNALYIYCYAHHLNLIMKH